MAPDEALLNSRSVIRHSHPRPFALPALLAIAAVSLRAPEAAAETQVAEQSWREPRQLESTQRFAFELRFGPYRPAIDDTFPQQKPYETVFGSDRRVAVALEFDWQLLRIPHVGTFGPGVGWGYTAMSAPARLASGGESAEETTLGIMPMYGVGVLRVDELVRQVGIPLVGYGKAGIGYGLYWTGESETLRRGRTWGTHFALGGMFLLDVIDNHAAMEIDNEWGVNNSYVFFEWMVANLNDFKSTEDPSVMRIGTNTWMMGLAFEM